MGSFLWIAGYCILAIVVAAAMESVTRKLWLLALGSATATATLAQAVVYAYLGFFDTWAYVVIVPSWIVALVCAIAYWAVAKRIREGQSSQLPRPPEVT